MPSYIYEGSDTDDEETVVNVKNVVRSTNANSGESSLPYSASESLQSTLERLILDGPELEVGQLVAADETFAAFLAIKSYPFMFVGKANQAKVAARYFDNGKLYNNAWDLFYLHGPAGEGRQPVVLVTTSQLKRFFEHINSALGTNLVIPSGAHARFQVEFNVTYCPRPRYLGRSTSKAKYETLRNSIPWPTFKPNEDDVSAQSFDRSSPILKAKFDGLVQGQQTRGKANKEKQKRERLSKVQSWGSELLRVQRYLGLRKSTTSAVEVAEMYQPDKLALYEMEDDVIFIGIDVEAWERSKSVITEVGIATLDTRDLRQLTPGEYGKNWNKAIRGRHFRIEENKHYTNKEFVEGCADRYDFGKSEFVKLIDLPHTLALCFKPPYGKKDNLSGSNMLKRKIVLVGHDVSADIKYLQYAGYDIYNLNLQEIVDTTHMWQYLTRDVNSRNLGAVLHELNLLGWNLHNAGNDAVYTLQAMIGTAFKYLESKSTKGKSMVGDDSKVEGAGKGTVGGAWEDGWTSDDQDGGVLLTPHDSSAGKGALQTLGSGSKTSNVHLDSPWTDDGQGSVYYRAKPRGETEAGSTLIGSHVDKSKQRASSDKDSDDTDLIELNRPWPSAEVVAPGLSYTSKSSVTPSQSVSSMQAATASQSVRSSQPFTTPSESQALDAYTDQGFEWNDRVPNPGRSERW